MIECDYHEIEDSDKWEIYVKYRKIISQFLTSQPSLTIHQPSNYRSSVLNYSVNLFVGQVQYVSLAKYLLSFLSEGLR
jgi:hypothetical protein